MEDDSKSELEPPARSATLAELFQYATFQDKVLMGVGTFAAIVTGACQPVSMIFFGKIIDGLNENDLDVQNTVNNIIFLFIGLAGLNVFTSLLQITCWTIAGERQVQRMRTLYVRSIFSQEIGWFDLNGASALSTQTADLLGKVQDGITRRAADMIMYAATFALCFVVALTISWRLALVLLCVVPLLAGAGYLMISAVTNAEKKSGEQYAKAGGLAIEMLKSVRTVTALNMQPDAIARYRVYIVEAMNIGVLKGLMVGVGTGLTFFVSYLTYALGFWYGTSLVADDIDDNCSRGCLTGGDVIATFFSIIIGATALGQVFAPLTAFFTAKSTVCSIIDVIDRKPLIDNVSDEGLKPKKCSGQIDLRDVHFAYPSRMDIMVCTGYNLTIKSGETVALCGASGCGKSTIMSLLLRFYDPNSGVVSLDGVDIRDLNIRWLRSQIGYVGQEPVLFQGSIYENIVYGLDLELLNEKDDAKKKAFMGRVIEACKSANAHKFITSFSNGYDTAVGANGVSLSGGQKQRIAIARALIKKPAVLLLDEATSALDVISEQVVQEAIDKLQQSKAQTTLVIAHRLSTIRAADKIALVKDGKIAELGTHDELLAINGHYADLVTLQLTSAADDAVIAAGDASREVAAEENKDEERGRRETDEGAVRKSEGSEIIDDAKADKSKDVKEKGQLKRKIWKLMRPFWYWIALGLFGSLLVGASFPIWGLLLAQFQSAFYLTDTDEMRAESVVTSEYFILLGVMCLVGNIVQQFSIAQAGERAATVLRSMLFESFIRREISFFDKEENGAGSLTTRLADDARKIVQATGVNLASQLQAIFTLFVAMIIGFTASWRISLVVLATFPITIFAGIISARFTVGQNFDPSGDSHGEIISSGFLHMRTVTAFSMQHRICNLYEEKTEEASRHKKRMSVPGGLALGFLNLTTYLMYSFLFWYGSELITDGIINFKQLMTAILSLMLGALGLGQALNRLMDQGEALEAARRIFNALDEADEDPIDGMSGAGKVPEKASVGRIELKGVSFRYPTRPLAKVCKDYSLVVEPGELVALVGPSGSGKSTIINLLLRFYDPNSGVVSLDGVDIRDLNVRWLRSQIGYVGQEPVLFSGSIAENIAYGRQEEREHKSKSLEELMSQKPFIDTVMQDKSIANCCRCCNTKTEGERESVTRKCASTLYESLLNGPASPDRDPKGRSSESRDSQGSASGSRRSGSFGISMKDFDEERDSKGKNEGADPDIVDAAKASSAHDFISSFAEGYETDVGENSVMVSGGQKQRIAIARALIKKPAVLLLDEATSALDAVNEKLVQASIDKLQQSKQQTTIVIAHRLTTIRGADKIVVVDKGMVIESGTHDELLSLGGLYRELWEKQTGGRAPLNEMKSMKMQY